MRIFASPGASAVDGYTEHLSVADLSVGTYRIPVGGTDGQSPHTEDEVYIVLAGRAVLRCDSGDALVVPDADTAVLRQLDLRNPADLSQFGGIG